MIFSYNVVKMVFLILFQILEMCNTTTVLVVLKMFRPFIIIFTLSAGELSPSLNDHSFLGFTSFLLDVADLAEKLEVKDMIRCLVGRKDISSLAEDAATVQPPETDLPVVNAAFQWVPLVVLSLNVLGVILFYSSQY
jgi:hypothetical protein